MWTLFAAPAMYVAVEGADMRETEERFAKKLGKSRLAYLFHACSAETLQEAWNRQPPYFFGAPLDH